jgi:hypothetical protein
LSAAPAPVCAPGKNTAKVKERLRVFEEILSLFSCASFQTAHFAISCPTGRRLRKVFFGVVVGRAGRWRTQPGQSREWPPGGISTRRQVLIEELSQRSEVKGVLDRLRPGADFNGSRISGVSEKRIVIILNPIGIGEIRERGIGFDADRLLQHHQASGSPIVLPIKSSITGDTPRGVRFEARGHFWPGRWLALATGLRLHIAIPGFGFRLPLQHATF